MSPKASKAPISRRERVEIQRYESKTCVCADGLNIL